MTLNYSSSCDLPIFPKLVHLLPSRVKQIPGGLRLFGSLEAQYFDLLAKLLVLIVEGGHLEVRLRRFVVFYGLAHAPSLVEVRGFVGLLDR